MGSRQWAPRGNWKFSPPRLRRRVRLEITCRVRLVQELLILRKPKRRYKYRDRSKKMMKETPHDFREAYTFLTPSEQQVKLRYRQLLEINQGGPLKGGVWLQVDGQELPLAGEFGGPPFHTACRTYLLLPRWRRSFWGRIDGQDITIVDLDRMVTKRYAKKFRLIQFEGEQAGKLRITDSPGLQPEKMEISIQDILMAS